MDMVRSTSTRLRAVGYTRVSTEEQHNRPKDDRERITAACISYQYDLVEFVEDKDVSGKVPLAEREHGRRVHELIETKQPWADVLVVTAIDRLTREAEDGISLIKRLMPNGGRHKPVLLVSLDDHIDLAGATGRMIAKFRIVLAEYERELIGERTANALRHRRRAGLPYAGTSYGWDRAGDHALCRPKHCGCRLVPNPEEQRVIADMKAWRMDGINDNRIAAQLNDAGVPTKQGRRWYATSVYNTLRYADEIGSAVLP